MLLALITELLQKSMPCEIIGFENADSVMDHWELETPDLVILDYQFESSGLKYSNGLEFLRVLQAKSKVPVIMLSGQTKKEVMTTLIQNGASDYIPKDEPNFMDALLHSVETILKFQETQRNLKNSVLNVNTQFLAIGFLILLGLIAFIFFF